MPRPQRSLLSAMQLFFSTIAASATPAIAVLDQPLTSLESSMISTAEMQPQINATFLKTTSAKKIATNDYQVGCNCVLFSLLKIYRKVDCSVFSSRTCIYE